jgi:hypothetical protein
MSNEQGKRWVSKMMETHGCIPGLSDGGTTIIEFRPQELAQALASEIGKAAATGLTKITIHLDLPDAALLARFLQEKS